MRGLKLALALALVGLSGCSSTGRAGEAKPINAATTTTVPAATSTSAPPLAGCGSPSGVIPAGSKLKPTIDVDGDGRADVLWFGPRGDGGTARFGVKTARGRIVSATFDTASPVGSSALAIRVNPRDPAMILVFNRGAYLFTYRDCTIVRVVGADGNQFAFGLGWGDGTGVACLDNGGGGRELVELFDLRGSNDGTGPVPWKKTIVRVESTNASIGQTVTGTYQLPRDQRAVNELHGFTCGTVTSADAVSE